MAEATCWTLVERAATGESAARDEFTSRYLPVVSAYLHARWKNRLSGDELADAVQEVFVECLREGGVLERVRSGPREGFRAFLFGVVRNVALRAEAARARRLDAPRSEAFLVEALAADDESLSRAFDRSWAESILREAADLQALQARNRDLQSLRRVELLRLVFQEGRTIADVARQWSVEADFLHHEYGRARAEFLGALKTVVAFHNPGSPEVVQRECRELVRLFA